MISTQPVKKIPSSTSPTRSSTKSPTGSPRLKRHKRYYMPEGNIVIQVENTLFKLDLQTLHDHSPVLRNIVPPLQNGSSLPVIGYNDRRPLRLREVAEVDFVRLLGFLFPSAASPVPSTHSPDALLSVLKLSSHLQMDVIHTKAFLLLGDLPAEKLEPARKVAIFEQFHPGSGSGSSSSGSGISSRVNSPSASPRSPPTSAFTTPTIMTTPEPPLTALRTQILLPPLVHLTRRVEPLSLGQTMTLGLRTFTKVAMCRDLYRQRLAGLGCCSTRGCHGCGCRQRRVQGGLGGLGDGDRDRDEEEERMAKEVVCSVFGLGSEAGMKCML